MDDLEDLLTALRQNCARLPVHTNSAKQLRRRCTEAVVALQDVDTEPKSIEPAVKAVVSLMDSIVRKTTKWLDLNRVMSAVSQEAISDCLNSGVSDLQFALSPHKREFNFNFLKWDDELQKARAADVDALNKMLYNMILNDYDITQIRALPKDKIDSLIKLLEAAASRYGGERQESISTAMLALKQPTGGQLVDMTGMVKILADQPIIRGPMADFWLGGTSSGNLVVVKLFRSTAAGETNAFILREARICARLSHPHVLPMFGFARIENKLGSVSAWMKKGNSMNYILKDPSADPLKLCFEAAKGLQHVHSMGVVHGNIKPGTILLSDQGTAVLSSFVFSQPSHDTYATTQSHGTKFDWSTIAQYTSFTRRGDFTKDADILAFGLMMLQILTQPPMLTVRRADIKDTKSRTSPTAGFLPHHDYRAVIWDLVASCLQHDNIKTPTMDQIVEILGAVISSRPPSRSPTLGVISLEVLPDLSAEIRKLDTLPITGGGFCDIWLGERLGRQKVALKVLKMFGVPDQIRKRFLAEATLWSRLKHPNILEFSGICDHGTSLSMVSPWLKNSNVLHYTININPNANRFKLIHDTSEGLQYLHTYEPPIVHGDLKCANILVYDDGTACLTDFGLSKMHQEVTSLSLRDAGSQRFMAPELFSEEDNDGFPLKTLASDIYAFGQTIVELLSGQKPFFEVRQENLVHLAISRGQRPRRPDTDLARIWLTDPAWDLVRSMTISEKEKRPGIENVSQDIRSMWVESSTPARGILEGGT